MQVMLRECGDDYALDLTPALLERVDINVNESVELSTPDGRILVVRQARDPQTDATDERND